MNRIFKILFRLKKKKVFRKKRIAKNKNYLKYFSNDRDEAFVTLDNNKTLEISRRKFDTVSSNLLNQSLN